MSDVIERGDLYFLYRPKVRPEGKEDSVEGSGDVQRLFMVMHPQGRKQYRLAVLGRKHLPDIARGERLWGFIDRVERDVRRLQREFAPESYGTKTRGRRERPAARPAGEGVYTLVRHARHTHFAYVLELPKAPGEVQREFNIDAEGSYIISVKNPLKPSPRRAGLPREEKAALPQSQQARFRGRRFIDPDPPDLLDHAGTEFMLIGARANPEEELDVDLGAEEENAASSEILRDLHLRHGGTPLEPLFKGEWR
jgi:hypothetical protein